MIISSIADYQAAARGKLPPFLFHYIDGGAYSEHTLQANSTDLSQIALRQRVLKNVADLTLEVELFDQIYAMPVGLSPVGLTGMFARRGEVQAAKAAASRNVPFTLSTVSVCPIHEVQSQSSQSIWFQLYVLKDRGFMRDILQRAQDAGVKTLVFTVDMPVPGARYRDKHSGMSGRHAKLRQILQAVAHPKWAWDVGIMGKPHDLGNISTYRKKQTNLEDYIGWLGKNFDSSISWHDLQWIREFWQGSMLIKGILDVDDAKDAVRFGADGIIVSNHGGRQLDGVLSSCRALPDIAHAVKGDLKVVVDGGIRSGLDVVRMLALGADFTMVGRAFVYALAAQGKAGVTNMLDILAQEMRVAMALTGVTRIADITSHCLVHGKTI